MASLLSDEDIASALGAIAVLYMAAELEKSKRRRKTYIYCIVLLNDSGRKDDGENRRTDKSSVSGSDNPEADPDDPLAQPSSSSGISDRTEEGAVEFEESVREVEADTPLIEDSDESETDDSQPPATEKSTSRKRVSNPSSSKKSTPPEKRIRKYAMKWSEDPKLACFSRSVRCGRQTSREIVVKCIGNESLKEIVACLKIHKYSIIVDESTDVSTTKQLAIVVRVVNTQQCTVEDKFLQLLDVEDSSAEGLFHLLSTFFDENGIPFENMLGFAADNASVMMGSMGGLKAKLLDRVPHLFVNGCICHSLNLCSSAACLKLPSSVETLRKDIHNFINHSPKRLLKFKEFQQFVRVDVHRLLNTSQTRWLSLESVVDRTLEQWSALILFFQSEALESQVQSAVHILNALNNPLFKMYFTFLGYILPIINKMNREFQSESVMIHTAYSNICAFYRTILSNYIKKDILKSKSDPFKVEFKTVPISCLKMNDTLTAK
ncbi:LOW QUALITY PROTEIN: uncharacterized protein LOC135100933 [Scylla paramamosain]|uniref:LOW QUALITY PROTEIN: uncharacterized protein LOC135100933 n=1 Tax=Scylla paramamosain TaxID=85552 RepID=UPI003083D9A7